MHFLPTPDQLELRQGVRELLAARWPLDRLAAGFDHALWDELARTGVFSLRSDLGLGMPEAVLVFEELGRAGVPGPLVGTLLAAGRTPGPVPVLDENAHPLLLAHRDVASAVLVLGDDVRLAPVPAGEPVPAPVDPLSPLHELSAAPAGDRIGDATDATRCRLEGAVLTAALQIGIAARVTDLAVDYAKTREQFGRSIGSFQAVKHICADMFARAELARAAVHTAAIVLDDPQDTDVVRAVAGAKLLADEAATGNGRAAIQVHGGMGFTWEVPVHLFLKRAWLHATEFGAADDHAEDLAARL